MTKYYLSSPLRGVPLPGPVALTFSRPAGIAYASQTTNIPIRFSKPAELANAKAFSTVVYELLSVFSTAAPQNDALPGSMSDVENVIGGGVGYLPTGTKDVNYFNISADARDLIKSALRGVPDFNTDDEKWYPAPSKPEGNQTFNVYNLDPYVWFIHKVAGLSGYGFSFDDDTADVGADGTSELSITVGGLEGLTNKSEWKPSTPWGVVKSQGTVFQGSSDEGTAGKTVIALSDQAVYNQVKADDPANSLIGAYVTGPGIKPGTRIAAHAVINKNQFVLSQHADTSTGLVTLTFTGTRPK